MTFGGQGQRPLVPHPQIWRVHDMREITDMLRKFCGEFYMVLCDNYITPSSSTIWMTTYQHDYERHFTISCANIREFKRYMEMRKEIGREATMAYIKVELRDKALEKVLK
jgi:hypothetical protein